MGVIHDEEYSPDQEQNLEEHHIGRYERKTAFSHLTRKQRDDR